MGQFIIIRGRLYYVDKWVSIPLGNIESKKPDFNEKMDNIKKELQQLKQDLESLKLKIDK